MAPDPAPESEGVAVRSILLALAVAWLCCGPARAAAGSIVFLAGTHHTMPLSRFDEALLVEGIVKDVGEAIAQRLDRQARFIAVPPRRVPLMLKAGDADGICYILPQWVDGDYNWTRPIIPGHGVLVARAGTPIAAGIGALAGVTIGTVAAYRYDSFDKALGKRFQRDDAPAMESNVQKLLAGRMDYAIMEKMTFDYLMRGQDKPALRADLEFDPIRARCAFSRKSAIPFAQVEQAVKSLAEDGSFDRILARYR